MRVAAVCKNLSETGIDISILTTTTGRQHFEELGVKTDYLILKTYLEKIKYSSVGYVLLFFTELFEAPFLRIPNRYDILHSSSDFLYDIIPVWFYKKRHIGNKWVVSVHHKIDLPWRRKGNFLMNFLSYVSQQASFRIMRKNADLVLVLKTSEGQRLRENLISLGLPKKRIAFFINGVDDEFLKENTESVKKYDACSSSGLQATRGGTDLIYIWKEVCKYKKDATLVVTGRNEPEAEATMRKTIEREGLSKNILILENLPRKEYVKLIKSSRIYLNPKHEEGWGISVYEAMALGLPVVTYNLSAFDHMSEGLVKVPLGNMLEFAKAIREFLDCDQLRVETGKTAKKIANHFSWSLVAEEDLINYNSILDKK